MRNIKISEGCFENIDEIDNTKYFEPMLANKYEDIVKKGKMKFPCWAQPKLDGMRDIAQHTGMRSRKGKPIISAPHITHELESLFKEYPHMILDGELYRDWETDRKSVV